MSQSKRRCQGKYQGHYLFDCDTHFSCYSDYFTYECFLPFFREVGFIINAFKQLSFNMFAIFSNLKQQYPQELIYANL